MLFQGRQSRCVTRGRVDPNNSASSSSSKPWSAKRNSLVAVVMMVACWNHQSSWRKRYDHPKTCVNLYVGRSSFRLWFWLGLSTARPEPEGVTNRRSHLLLFGWTGRDPYYSGLAGWWSTPGWSWWRNLWGKQSGGGSRVNVLDQEMAGWAEMTGLTDTNPGPGSQQIESWVWLATDRIMSLVRQIIQTLNIILDNHYTKVGTAPRIRIQQALVTCFTKRHVLSHYFTKIKEPFYCIYLWWQQY